MTEPLPAVGASIPRQPISAELRRQVKLEECCRYCLAPWPCVVDHVIPVDQGGHSVIGNLAHACDRCNRQKQGRTPQQWRAWRLQRGLAWPPIDPRPELTSFLQTFDDDLVSAMRPLVDAAYTPYLEVIHDLLDEIYFEREWSGVEWAEKLRTVALEYQAHVDM